VSDRALAAGPARLTQALGIDRRLNGHRLARSPLWIAEGDTVSARRVAVTPRVGIRVATDWKLRFYVRGSPFVSRP
jgi:DNA-3-methyladenine glycosylase